MKTERNVKQDDGIAFQQLVRRNGSAWIVDQLQNLGGPQLVLLHLANSLSDDPSVTDISRVLFELIEKFEELHGWGASLDCILGELYDDYPLEPKPRVIQGYKLHLSEKTEAVLDALRLRGHRVEGETVSVLYAPGTDPYDTLDAADLDLEIRELATEHGVELDDDDLQIETVWGPGPQPAWR